MRKHIEKNEPLEQKVTDFEQKVTDFEQKVTDFEQKVTDFEQKVTDTILHENQCEKCEKILSNKKNYRNHIKKCKGKINPLGCLYCKKEFRYKSNKSNHQKICKAKEIIHEKPIILNIIENQNINTQNNIETQNNNIIIFASETGDMEFVKTPEFTKKLKTFLSGCNYIENIKNYNKEILSIKENQCVKKTNLRSSTSKVYIGHNKWETKNDADIYPAIACNLADDMCNVIMGLKQRDRYKVIERVLDCLADNGYINDTDEKQKEMEDNFKNIVKDLKLVIYDLTREE